MEILGIGLQELVLIFLLALIIFGPRDLEKAGRAMGRTLYRFLRSDTWKAIRQMGRLPAELVRQAGLEELREDLETVRKEAILPPDVPGRPRRPAAKAPPGSEPPPPTPDSAPGETASRFQPPEEGKG